MRAKARSGIDGAMGRGCQSPTWQETQAWPRAGDDGGCCSPCSAERDSSAGGWAWWTDHRYQSAMEEIESEIVAGRYAIACRNLDKLLSWKADPNGGIAYLLGSCELARGRNQAAGEAWARVVPGSAFSERAIGGGCVSSMNPGNLPPPSGSSTTPPWIPAMIGRPCSCCSCRCISELGRIDEAERLIEDRWEHLNASGEGALEPAIKLVRQHIELTLKATPVETVRAFLEQAVRLAPDDDRVWLGRANLAIRTGAYDEAERWLDACQQRRPEDVPVWRARLSWGIATNRIDVVQQALTHLPAAESNPAQLHRLNAWLAAQRGDVATERRELELLVAADPADVTALDRLAELAEKDGQPARAAELAAQESRNRSAARSLPETPRPETAHSRRGGNGPPGRAARPPVRGPSLSDHRDLGRPRPRGSPARPRAVERNPTASPRFSLFLASPLSESSAMDINNHNIFTCCEPTGGQHAPRPVYLANKLICFSLSR